jgi:2'-hydroxyisoflavone reductase
VKILILGGTVFLGRHLVELGLARGHTFTLFNRGIHNPDLFPGVEKRRGDRQEDLSALESSQWDAVIDTCGYLPRVVRKSAEHLRDRVEHYTFISSLSVYAEGSPPGTGESGETGKLEDETVEEITGETYGPLKALCERAVENALPGRALVIRPGLIVGPHDPSDRFTYWPWRISRGGEVLAPGRPGRPVQFVDVRDLSGWILDLVEKRQTGVFNATGPDTLLTMGQTLETCRAVTGSNATFTWVSDEFLLAQEVGAYSEMPLWVPEAEAPGFDTFDCRKAIAAGLIFRPLEDTVRDTLEWDQTRPADTPRRSGMSAERESALLKAWQDGG